METVKGFLCVYICTALMPVKMLCLLFSATRKTLSIGNNMQKKSCSFKKGSYLISCPPHTLIPFFSFVGSTNVF